MLSLVALTVATSTQAMTPAPIHQPDSLITQAAAGRGPGRTMVKGVYVGQNYHPPNPPTRRHGVCDGQESLALCTNDTPPNWRLIHHKSGRRADVVRPFPSTLRVLRRLGPPQARIDNMGGAGWVRVSTLQPAAFRGWDCGREHWRWVMPL